MMNKTIDLTCHNIADSLFMQPDSFAQIQADWYCLELSGCDLNYTNNFHVDSLIEGFRNLLNNLENVLIRIDILGLNEKWASIDEGF